MTRLVAGVLAALLVLSALVGVLSTVVSAAVEDGEIETIRTTGGSTVSRLRNGSKYNIKFSYTETDSTIIAGVQAGDSFSTANPNHYSLNNAWAKAGSKLTLTFRGETNDSNYWIVDGELEGVTYRSNDSSEFSLSVGTALSKTVGAGSYKPSAGITATVPASYFGGGENGGNDIPASYTSRILVENAVAIDSSGKRIDEITKDTPSFTVEVTFADVGLQHAHSSELDDGEHTAYFTGGAFEMKGLNRGTVRYINTSSSDYPRFRATFKDVTYTGSGKDFTFQVYYLFDEVDNAVEGEATARVVAAKAPDGEDDDDKKMGLPVPKIIISNYSYGDGAIIAGNEFNLSFTITNTSDILPLENIVLTLTPTSNEAATKGPGLIVASSSNTIYVPRLDKGASQDFTVAFQARPDAEVTSHLINVGFSYEYVDTNLESREKVPDLSESIAIPISQVDRFSVSPILETVYGFPGEEAYLTVNFMNKGKASTNNITITVQTDSTITAPSQYYGHLEAGKGDSVDIYLTPTEPGNFTGDVVVQYEDENSDVKELTTSFSMFVEEPYFPPADDPMPPDGIDGVEQQPPRTPLFNVVMCIVGGIAIAAPIALYLMKRVKAKGSEDFDEVF